MRGFKKKRLSVDDRTFATGMKTLCDFYNKPALSQGATGIWFSKVQFLHSQDFDAAVDAVTSREKYFPTPARLLELADEARARRASRELQKDKLQANDFFDPGVHRPGIGRDSVQFFDLLWAFKGPKEQKLELEIDGYKALHKKYPEAGFGKNYSDALRRFNELKGQQAA